LHGAGFRLPTHIYAHGYLMINGQKMSKSRNTFITARHYLQYLPPEYLRYYFAAKLSPHIEDIDLNLDDFRYRVNSDLVGKYVNIASRCAGFISKQFEGRLASQLPEPELYNSFVEAKQEIAESYESLNYHKTVRRIMALADQANQYIDQQKPWLLAKNPDTLQQVQAVCTQGINLFAVLSIYLKPILPDTAKKVETFLNTELRWDHLNQPLLNQSINPFQALMHRVESTDLESLIAKSTGTTP